MAWYILAAIGAAICLVVIINNYRTLPWFDVVFLSTALALLRQRSIGIRRQGPRGESHGMHHMGDAMILIAALRDGPAAALAVHLLSGFVRLPVRLHSRVRPAARLAHHLFFGPAMSWVGAWVYYLLGGHTIHVPADSALFFQAPLRILVPMLAMMFTQYDLLNRPTQAIILYFGAGIPVRRTLCDPLIAAFDYVEFLSGCQMLVLWNAWGWATVPFSLISNEAYIFGVRSYLERLAVQWQARRDPLTGLANWHGLEMALRERMRKGEGFALLFLDVDGLKRVNDALGHQAGDELLKLVGDVTRSVVDAGSIVGRRSGDEFIAVLTGADRSAGEKVAANLQKELESRLAGHAQFHLARGASAGVAIYPSDGSDLASLLEYADSQMYHNKRARRDAYTSEYAVTSGEIRRGIRK
jgi:diguanylate cyclase (GGDEF)-like protein